MQKIHTLIWGDPKFNWFRLNDWEQFTQHDFSSFRFVFDIRWMRYVSCSRSHSQTHEPQQQAVNWFQSALLVGCSLVARMQCSTQTRKPYIESDASYFDWTTALVYHERRIKSIALRSFNLCMCVSSSIWHNNCHHKFADTTEKGKSPTFTLKFGIINYWNLWCYFHTCKRYQLIKNEYCTRSIVRMENHLQ